MDPWVKRKARTLKASGFLERAICQELGISKDELGAALAVRSVKKSKTTRNGRRKGMLENLYASIAEACSYAPNYEVIVANFGNMVREEKLKEIWDASRADRSMPGVQERQGAARRGG